MSNKLPNTTDLVFVETLRVEANLGGDCWGRSRPQPVEVTVYLHLLQLYLQKAGHSDDVLDSVHYGHLVKEVGSLIRAKNESAQPEYDGPDALIKAVTEKAFELAGDAAAEVRVVLKVPKMILLASGFSVDITTVKGTPNVVTEKKVIVEDIIAPVLIGVNPPERENKQRVVVNIVFYEKLGADKSSVQYREIISNIVKEFEATSYLTLEKFVMGIVRSSCLASDRIEAVTARAQKPSAISFAQSSGVEITRKRDAFTN